MSWKKHFRTVGPLKDRSAATPGMPPDLDSRFGSSASSKFSSYLPEVYAGHPNRIMRYYQYDDMDRDSDINAALDTIADFCTQSEEQQENPFEIVFNADATEPERKVLTTMLTKWVKLNKFKSKLWHMMRKAIKYGDVFFLRDPETGEWLWVAEFSVQMITVDEERGRKPTEYVMRALDYNKQAKFGTKVADPSQYNNGMQQSFGGRSTSSATVSGSFSMVGAHNDGRRGRKPGQETQDLDYVVNADHVVHLSLSAEMDVYWPFGQSVLDPVFKTFKQKELLEDALIIYRVQRAPERRVFYIDTGTMPPPRAAEHINAVKNELHQRRIPNRTGGGAAALDGAYNPLSIMEDLFFAQSAEGRGSRVETLPGGDNLGEIGDVNYFNDKLARGLKIPPSYLAMGSENKALFNDGKLGQAAVEEFRFTKYCMRLQSLVAPVFDSEFKRFLRDDGADGIDPSIFELQFHPPQNFSLYRQMEVDQMQVGIYTQLADNKKIAERTKLKRYLGWKEDDLIENEISWKEENAAKLKKATGSTSAESESDIGLAGVGIRPGGDPMMDVPGEEPMDGEMGDAGAPGDLGGAGGAPMGGAPAPGGAPAAPAGGAPTL